MRIGAIRASLLILTYVMELQGKGAFLPNDAIEELLTQDPSYDNDTSYMVTNCTSPNCQKEEDYEDDETLRTLKFIGTRMSIGILAALSFLTLFTCLYFCFSRGSSKRRQPKNTGSGSKASTEAKNNNIAADSNEVNVEVSGISEDSGSASAEQRKGVKELKNSPTLSAANNPSATPTK